MRYSNGLRIRQRMKGIPYGGTGEMREDGEANYGFTNLKGHLDRLDQVPELVRDQSLRDLVRVINEPTTGLLTVGCLSAPVDEQQGHRVTGYIEIAFNSCSRIADASNYFPVFFYFDRALHESNFDEDMHFGWELEGATFLDTNATGFTASIFLNTGFQKTADEARTTWSLSLDFLGQYLSSVKPDGTAPLF